MSDPFDVSQIEFATVSGAIQLHAAQSPNNRALVAAGIGPGTSVSLSYAELDALMNQVGAALQREGLQAGDAIAICANSSVEYAAVFLGALRAGVVVAPLAPSSTPASLARMIDDAQAKIVFADLACADLLSGLSSGSSPPCILLDGQDAKDGFKCWLTKEGAKPQATEAAAIISPSMPFNIIYSSGTTGEPKGIVQSHGMRWAHVRRASSYGYGPTTAMLLSTPLYSNTTLVVFFPTLFFGGTVVLMPRFEAGAYLKLAQQERITHTMLVPVQYQRLMARPDFANYDLSSFKIKFSTSAPFSALLKADVLKRWPGGLVEFYGMTEGGGSFILDAHLHPTKLHTVGRAAPGSDIRLIDEEGLEVAQGQSGEVVGHSLGMMIGYHRQPAKTREAEWFDALGKRFIRTGDIGRFDEEGFLTLFDRKKDMIISGGFNIYPSDLEAILCEHPGVLEAAVVGVPSEQWGETPIAFVVCKAAVDLQVADLTNWFNLRVGKTQRLSQIEFVSELPRSAIGKVLKRELRDQYTRLGAESLAQPKSQTGSA